MNFYLSRIQKNANSYKYRYLVKETTSEIILYYIKYFQLIYNITDFFVYLPWNFRTWVAMAVDRFISFDALSNFFPFNFLLCPFTMRSLERVN